MARDEQLQDALRASEAERSLINLMLQDNSIFKTVSLSPELFNTQLTRRMFEGISELVNGERLADHITLADYLQNKFPSINWMPEVIELASNNLARPEGAQHYAGILHSAHHRRASERIAMELLHNSKEGQKAIDEAIRELMAINSDNASHNYDTKALITGALDKTEQAFERAQNGQLVGINTGLDDLNTFTGGWHETDLIVIPARPAMGKTAILLNLLLNAEVPFGLISSEQAYEQIGQRLIAIQGRVSGARIRSGSLVDEDWGRLSAGAGALMQRQMYVNDDSAINIDGIKRQARQWVHQHGIKILGVDYIQRIQPLNRSEQKHHQVEQVVMGLKSLAKELNIPIIALAQVNRSCEGREDKRPLMGDIADASAVEKEADVVATLYRDEVYNPDTQFKGVVEINICKNRHGGIGTVVAAWQGACFRVDNLNRGGH